MKIKKKAAAAAAFLTMTNFSACSNFNQDVYGPPPDEWEIEQKNDTETVSNEEVTQNDSEASTDNSETSEGDDVQ